MDNTLDKVWVTHFLSLEKKKLAPQLCSSSSLQGSYFQTGLDHCVPFVCHLYRRNSGAPVLFPIERESKHRVVFPPSTAQHVCGSIWANTTVISESPSWCSSGDLLNLCLPSVPRTNQMLLFAYLLFILLLLRQLSSVQFVYPEDKYRWL